MMCSPSRRRKIMYLLVTSLRFILPGHRRATPSAADNRAALGDYLLSK